MCDIFSILFFQNVSRYVGDIFNYKKGMIISHDGLFQALLGLGI